MSTPNLTLFLLHNYDIFKKGLFLLKKKKAVGQEENKKLHLPVEFQYFERTSDRS